MNTQKVTNLLQSVAPFEPIPCEHGGTLYIAEHIGKETFSGLCTLLEIYGFSRTEERNFDRVCFVTEQSDTDTVWLSYDKPDGTLRAVAEPFAHSLPEESFSPLDAVVHPTVTQIRNLYFSADCGMSYLIRLSDGRFVLIDGGIGEYEEPAHLWELLCRQRADQERPPVIAAWFITHPHEDHFGCFVRFYRDYGKFVNLEHLIYNWATPDKSRGMSDTAEFDRIAASLPDGTVITPHTGQQLRFADAVFDVLFVCEDLYPAFINNLNDTSTVLRMTLGGHRVMWLGDAMKKTADLLCRRYSPQELACDVMQVAHHGYYGASPELYRCIRPQILLWPCPDFWFHVVREWQGNELLKDSPDIRATYVAGQEEVVLDFTKQELSCFHEQTPHGSPTIYSTDFSDGSVLELHWSCITGGKTGCAPLQISFPEPGEACLTAQDTDSVCEILRPGLLDGIGQYTLCFSGRADAPTETVGLLWNEPNPTAYSGESVLPLEFPVGEEVCYSLWVDSGSGRAVLSRNGSFVSDIPGQARPGCGLYLVMKKAELLLHEILITGDCTEPPINHTEER